MDNRKETEEIAIIHVEAALGSSLLNISVVNADAAQLLAAAEMIRAHGMVALSQEMARAKHSSRSPIVVPEVFRQ